MSAPEVKPGQLVAVCYTVEHARVVTIAPGGFRSSAPSACASHQPTKTTTYVVTATGAAGEKDEERVKVLVR